MNVFECVKAFFSICIGISVYRYVLSMWQENQTMKWVRNVVYMW